MFVKKDDGSEIYCYDVDPEQTLGDYWCPTGFYYDYAGDEVCKKWTDVCDKGFDSNLEYGCDNPFDPNDDELWKLYQEECVSQEYVVGEPYYDSLCCLNSVFNGFYIYTDVPDTVHVKIY